MAVKRKSLARSIGGAQTVKMFELDCKDLDQHPVYSELLQGDIIMFSLSKPAGPGQYADKGKNKPKKKKS